MYSRCGDRDRSLEGYLANGTQGQRYGLRRISAAEARHVRRVAEDPLRRPVSIAFGVQPFRGSPSCYNLEEEWAGEERLATRPAPSCYCALYAMHLADIRCHSIGGSTGKVASGARA